MIKICNNSFNRTVSLSTLSVGDTFLMDGNVCMLAKRNGHPFILDLRSGKDYSSVNPNRSDLRVTPIECELSYELSK